MDRHLTLTEHEIDVVLEALFFKYKRLAKMLKNDHKLLNTVWGERWSMEAVELAKLREKIIEERKMDIEIDIEVVNKTTGEAWYLHEVEFRAYINKNKILTHSQKMEMQAGEVEDERRY